MPSTRVTSSELQKEYDRYSTLAKRQAVTIANHGRPELVDLDADEYVRLRRLDTRVAMPTTALSEEELDALERSEIPEETRKLDVLVPKGWQWRSISPVQGKLSAIVIYGGVSIARGMLKGLRSVLERWYMRSRT